MRLFAVRKLTRIAGLTLIGSLIWSAAVPAIAATDSGEVRQIASSLNQTVASVAQPHSIKQLRVDEKTGKPKFVLGDLSDPLQSDDAVLNYVSGEKKSFALNEPLTKLSLQKKFVDGQNKTHYLYQQNYQGIPVYGKYSYAHLDEQRKLYAWSNSTDESVTLSGISTIPGLSSDEAIRLYQEHLEQVTGQAVQTGGEFLGQSLPQPAAELTIYADGAVPVLAYLIRLESASPKRASWVAVVNAGTGEVLLEYNRVEEFDKTRARSGTGAGHNGQTRPLHIYLEDDNRYYLADVTKNMQNNGAIFTVDFGDGYTVSSDTPNFTDPDAVDVHYFTGLVYDYYRNNLGRDSFDGAGKSIVSFIHTKDKDGASVANAYWEPVQGVLVYGDGDGDRIKCMTCELDVIAHEYTHGVTAFTANLSYTGQSGALNESISDMMAAVIDGNWTLGEDTGSIVRSMSDPNTYDQPKEMDQYVNTFGDNHGVHINSGIPNHAAYKLAGKLEALGFPKWDTLGRIVYHALNYLTPSSDFYDARDAFAAAAASLGYNSDVSKAVTDAWAEVGIAGAGYVDPVAVDGFEGNDSTGEADGKGDTPFGSLDATVHLGDVDYYRYNLSVTDYVYAEISGFKGHMRAELLNAEEVDVTASHTVYSSEIMKIKLNAGKYYLAAPYGYYYDSKGPYNLFLAPAGNLSLFQANLKAKLEKAQALLAAHPYVSESGRTDLKNAIDVTVSQSVYAATSEQFFDLTTVLNGAIRDFTEETDQSVPSWPANKAITAKDITQSGLKLSWTAAADDKGVTAYKVYQGDKLIGTVNGTVTDYPVSGLEAGTTYTFAVQAGDAVGKWSKDGPTITVTTASSGGGGGGGGGFGGIMIPPGPNVDGSLVKEEDLKAGANGKVTVKAAAGKNEVLLPANTGELLGTNVLVVELEGAKAAIDPSVLKELVGLLGTEHAVDAKIRFKAEKTDPVQGPALSAAESRAVLKPGSPIYDFTLTIEAKDGTSKKLDRFAAPIELTFSYSDTGLNEQLVGVYYYNEASNSWEYAGGAADPALNLIHVKLTHFSKYAVLEFTKTFDDVPKLHWSRQAVEILAAKHIINGVTDTKFAPDGLTTRAEFAALLTRALGLTAKGTAPFRDVQASDWYAQPVAAAFEARIINGKSQDAFAPGDTITREEMAAMIVRAYQYKTGRILRTDPVSFKDANQVSDWAKASINASANEGLMTGTGDHIFDPKQQTNRAQSAQVIYNLLQKL